MREFLTRWTWKKFILVGMLMIGAVFLFGGRKSHVDRDYASCMAYNKASGRTMDCSWMLIK